MYCNLVRLDEPISIVSAHLLFRKGSPLVKAVDEAITKNKMLIGRAFRKYMDTADVSLSNNLTINKSHKSLETWTWPLFNKKKRAHSSLFWSSFRLYCFDWCSRFVCYIRVPYWDYTSKIQTTKKEDCSREWSYFTLIIWVDNKHFYT